jgi:transcriptional regulator with XRE-family HTH domain
MTDDRAARAAAKFADALARLRESRGLSKKDLAARMGFDPSYVSHVENGRHKPTNEFAGRADAVLRAGGTLRAAFEEFWAASSQRARPRPPAPAAPAGVSKCLVVRHEEASLTLGDDGYYHINIRREVHNAGDDPVTRFPVRIEVDAHPADSHRSRMFYRDNPVTLPETQFRATFNGEPTSWRLVRDRDAYKKIHIIFEPYGLPCPLYTGDSAVIECGYRVPTAKWGDWFEREIRWPTESLTVTLRFPVSLDVRLTAREVTWGGDRFLPSGMQPLVLDGTTNYTWSTSGPALTNQYRFDWQIAAARR